MKKNQFLKVVICLMLSLSCAACSPSGQNQYQIPDKNMPNSMFSTKELFSFQPLVSKISSTQVDGVHVSAIMFESMPVNGKKIKTFAYMGFPETSKKVGGMILVHGGEGYADAQWVASYVKKGFAAIAIDFDAQMCDENGTLNELNRTPNVEGGKKGYSSYSDIISGCEDKESWVYQSVANIIFANNILRADSRVNAEQIGLTGLSWGGYLTCIAAGVDKRFAFFAPIYGCGYMQEDTFSSAAFLSMNDKQKETYLTKYDAAAYLKYATKPMLFVTGASDAAFSLSTHAKSVEEVPGVTFMSIRKSMSHSHYNGSNVLEVVNFAKHIFYNENTILVKATASKQDNTAVFTSSVNLKIKTIDLVYTKSADENSHLWSFESIPVKLNDKTAKVELPENTHAFFFSGKDEIGNNFSTRVVMNALSAR